ncbi:MAG: chromate transporter [Thermomonas sp.]|uniref:chromate transporter n=1 Tax=Thermomonas sp. TaxID=1971895 RepID=UPI0026387F5D|nr:chromate transporter [Thermomonas sp.]MCC7095826.1 chromate transporter [Thermomonas sp.]
MQPLDPPHYKLRELAGYFLKLGTVGFGGPVALVGYMHRDLVEQRRWISESDYKEGLALSQIAPGPLAAQLAIYLGYVHYRILGATLVGLAFVLPSFLMVLALGWAYTHFGGLPWMQAVFYGVGAAVIGIIAISAQKLTIKNIRKDGLLWGIFTVLAAVTIITETEMALLFIAAGLLVLLLRGRLGNRTSRPLSLFLAPIALPQVALAAAGESHVLIQIAYFFTKAGAFVFGSGLAIVPFLYGGVVTEYRWLSEQQFVDAVAVAMITPGPVVITTAFIGYLVAGVPGACVAAIATFLPCYLLTILPAPYFKKYGKHPALKAFVDGITAAAIGAIAGSVVILAQRAVVDVFTALLALGAGFALWRFKSVKEPVVVLAAALLGSWVHPMLSS